MNPKKTFVDRMECLWSEEIPAYLAGETDEGTSRFLQEHWQECFYCKERLQETRHLIEKMRKYPDSPSPDLSHKIVERIPPHAWKPSCEASKRITVLGPLAAALVLFSCFFLWKSFGKFLVPFSDRGTESVPQIVDGALDWLAKNQLPEGSWDVSSLGGQEKYTIGLTGLALITFMERKGDSFSAYRKNVEKGIAYLIGQQNAGGLFGPIFDESLYNQGIATLALLKANECGVGRPEWREKTALALRYICNAQDPSGGWGYRSSPSNSSISTWQLHALTLAHSQGWKNVEKNIEMGKAWLRRMVNEEGFIGYQRINDFPYGHETPTAMGTFILYSRDIPHVKNDQTQKALCRIASSDTTKLDYYRVYFLSRAFEKAHVPISPWHQKSMDWLLARKIKLGKHQGSWEPVDSWGKVGGRIYSTAMAALTLPLLTK